MKAKVSGVELFHVLTVPEAREVLAARWPELKRGTKKVSLTGALRCELAVDIVAAEDVPGFARSTMDGYAVRAQDTFGATESQPAYLALAGEVFMGEAAGVQVLPGTAVAIATGGMLPPGADAVVMVENTESVDGKTVAITRPVAPGENLVKRGEDVRAGQKVLAAGRRLRPQDLGILASLGFSEVEVYEPWRIGILATGNEIVPPEVKPGPGQVRDINSYTLFGLSQACGAEPRLYGIVPDDLDKLKAVAWKALNENHILLFSGGSSVGTRDLTLQVIASLDNPEILFHGISIRPGKPTLAAVTGGKLVIGLPGHPVSAMIIFDLFLRPLILYGGYNDLDLLEGSVKAVLTRKVASGADREDHVRVRLLRGEAGLLADPVPGKSGLISTMVQADGLVKVPLECEGLEAGSIVEVRLFTR
ncbi:MAG: molybdopterin molybdotransferase [Clostridia bacterium]|nr:molybdopterin molybdotransferase [Clostridia bacterium]